MKKIRQADPTLQMNVIYNGRENMKMSEVHIIDWREMHSFNH
ncbi:MAG: hypothetical protein WAU01_11590 [Saprospiraceae bacterium]